MKLQTNFKMPDKHFKYNPERIEIPEKATREELLAIGAEVFSEDFIIYQNRGLEIAIGWERKEGVWVLSYQGQVLRETRH